MDVFETVKSSIDPYICTFVVGIVQLFATGSKNQILFPQRNLTLFSVSALIVDKAGRRPLLLMSAGVMSLCMGGLALYLTLIDSVPGQVHGNHGIIFQRNISESLGWLPLMLIIGSFVGYSIGFATIPFLIMGELLPLKYDHCQWKASNNSQSFQHKKHYWSSFLLI